jgi:hypothetical protein
MQPPSTDSLGTPGSTWPAGQSELSPSHPALADSQLQDDGALLFEGNYAGQMEMAASPPVVGAYLNQHQGWFPRCADPMQVSPISSHGYALVVGHYSVLGYEVEPKVGLYLSPLEQRTYRIDTIPVPDYEPPGYDVDFKAILELRDHPPQGTHFEMATLVDWSLNLTVKIHVPKFVSALPRSLVKASGDRLLNQVVRQVSKRLTRKVQEDFHTTQNLPLPDSYHRHHFWSNWGRGTAV